MFSSARCIPSTFRPAGLPQERLGSWINCVGAPVREAALPAEGLLVRTRMAATANLVNGSCSA